MPAVPTDVLSPTDPEAMSTELLWEMQALRDASLDYVAKLGGLLEQKLITQAEFEEEKRKVLSSPSMSEKVLAQLPPSEGRVDPHGHGGRRQARSSSEPRSRPSPMAQAAKQKYARPAAMTEQPPWQGPLATPPTTTRPCRMTPLGHSQPLLFGTLLAGRTLL